MYPKIRSRWAIEDRGVEETIYSKAKREVLVDEGALSYEEEGFMEGYEEDFLDSAEDELLI
ncbi:MAG TPA: hypothetical protein VJI15_02655 [Candidatus Nanoarchaeia archaeon]|nr:hypothetical protein [Candidatus Nanoarchaeia archaeon]